MRRHNFGCVVAFLCLFGKFAGNLSENPCLLQQKGVRWKRRIVTDQMKDAVSPKVEAVRASPRVETARSLSSSRNSRAYVHSFRQSRKRTAYCSHGKNGMISGAEGPIGALTAASCAIAAHSRCYLFGRFDHGPLRPEYGRFFSHGKKQ